MICMQVMAFLFQEMTSNKMTRLDFFERRGFFLTNIHDLRTSGAKGTSLRRMQRTWHFSVKHYACSFLPQDRAKELQIEVLGYRDGQDQKMN
jgi:hypothetical protein